MFDHDGITAKNARISIQNVLETSFPTNVARFGETNKRNECLK